jgi:hypothetical protein
VLQTEYNGKIKNGNTNSSINDDGGTLKNNGSLSNSNESKIASSANSNG